MGGQHGSCSHPLRHSRHGWQWHRMVERSRYRALLWYNPNTQSVSEYTWTLPAGKIAFHPGSQGQNSVVRWTAPAGGSVVISGDFIGYDYQYPTTTDVHVLYDASVSLFDGNIASYNVPLNFSVTRAVNPGDTIDFNVGYGGDDSYLGDTTGLDVS